MRMRWVALLALGLAACGDEDPEESGPSGELQWYLNCGDPVCQGYTGPFDGVALCGTGEESGDPCANEGATCDPQDGCNALRVCATEDPTQQEGGCPISRARYKHGITYVGDAERASLGQQALGMKLARWRYNAEGAEGPEHLGFIIDDAPQSFAVLPSGERVDVYGYTSLVLAAVQDEAERSRARDAELEALRAELAGMRQELAQLRDGVCGP